MSRRVGIFGGMFDPPHLGHVAIAEAAAAQAMLDVLIVMPCGMPPHRSEPPIASPEDRTELCRLAFSLLGDVEVIISDLELRRSDRSYTFDTLQELQRGEPESEFCLILGYDAFSLITTWKNWQHLFLMGTFWVAGRGEPNGIEGLTQEQWHQVHSLSMRPVEVSSSQVRERVAAGLSISDFVPSPVALYIERKQLYRNLGQTDNSPETAHQD